MKTRIFIGVVLALVLGGGVILYLRFRDNPSSPATLEYGKEIALPAPKTVGTLSCEETLAKRRSHREFSNKPLSLEQISQLCWAAQGITEKKSGFRTAPSAGGLFPVTVFVLDAEGMFAYFPAEHVLRQTLKGDLRPKLRKAAYNQAWVEDAPLMLIIAVDMGKTAIKYGAKAERYCWIEVGHVGQNVLLQATAMELAAVPVGGFEEQRVSTLLSLPETLRPVYLIPLGYPKNS